MNMQNENIENFIDSLKEEDAKKRKKEKKTPLVSKVLSDGTIVETVYDYGANKTSFCIFKDKWDIKSSVTIGKTLHKPLLAEEDIIKNNVVQFASIPEEYVSEEELIREITDFLHRYVDLPKDFEFISAQYVLFSWLYDKFRELPYLRVIADFGSGKTRFLQTIGAICYKPMLISGATTASPIFRIIDQIRGTLIIDEADFRFSDTTQDIIKILNVGYTKGVSLLRTEGKGEFEIRAFDPFCPKIIAGREPFRDKALESRCLTCVMEPTNREDIPLNLDSQFQNEALKIRNKLLLFRFRNFHNEIDGRVILDRSLEPRIRQILNPLLSIITSEKARESLLRYSKKINESLLEEREGSFDADIFKALLVLLKDGKEPSMKDIADGANLNYELKHPIHPRKIGSIIKNQFNLKKHKINRGYVIRYEDNKERIEKLKVKYGIEDEKVNVVNVVNVPEDAKKQEGLTSADVEEVFGKPSTENYPF